MLLGSSMPTLALELCINQNGTIIAIYKQQVMTANSAMAIKVG